MACSTGKKRMRTSCVRWVWGEALPSLGVRVWLRRTTLFCCGGSCLVGSRGVCRVRHTQRPIILRRRRAVLCPSSVLCQRSLLPPLCHPILPLHRPLLILLHLTLLPVPPPNLLLEVRYILHLATIVPRIHPQLVKFTCILLLRSQLAWVLLIPATKNLQTWGMNSDSLSI